MFYNQKRIVLRWFMVLTLALFLPACDDGSKDDQSGPNLPNIEDDPPERVRYAEMRLWQLSVDGSTRPLPNPTADPPPTYEHEYPRSPPSEYPTSGCTPLCNDDWAECNTHCEMKDKHCTAACQAAYRVCIGGCP